MIDAKAQRIEFFIVLAIVVLTFSINILFVFINNTDKFIQGYCCPKQSENAILDKLSR